MWIMSFTTPTSTLQTKLWTFPGHKKKVIDKDINDFQLKLSDDMDCSKWKEIITAN